MKDGRLAIDISSIVRWVGPPSGMIRVEHEIARYALSQVTHAVFTIYDSEKFQFQRVRREWVHALIDYAGCLLPPEQEAKRKRILPRLLPKRRIIFLRLEKRRINAKSRAARRFYADLQRLVVIGRRLPFDLYMENGIRRNLIRYEDAIEGGERFKPGDRLLMASSDWWHKRQSDVAYIADLARGGVCLTAVCYDILPLMRPEWFGQPSGTNEDIRRFKAYWDNIFPAARSIIVNSYRVKCDVLNYTEKHGIALNAIHVVPLGSNRPASNSPRKKPDAALKSGHFALFVSTIEPRKNHAMLLRIWRRLLNEGVPQSRNFSLVFVGRRGWKVDEVLAALADPEPFGGTVIHFDHLGDEHLEWLYANCAFCVYPSEYEGFGLPVAEAFARGKAVIASNGGSLGEVVGTLSPTLDPKDDNVWFDTLRDWIEDPHARRAFEVRISQTKIGLDWHEVAGRIMDVVEMGNHRDGDRA